MIKIILLISIVSFGIVYSNEQQCIDLMKQQQQNLDEQKQQMVRNPIFDSECVTSMLCFLRVR